TGSWHGAGGVARRSPGGADRVRHLELRPLPTGKPLRAVPGPADTQCPARCGGRGEPPPRPGRTRPPARIPACPFARQAARGDWGVGRAAGDCLSPAEPVSRWPFPTGAVMTDHYDVVIISSGAVWGHPDAAVPA